MTPERLAEIKIAHAAGSSMDIVDNSYVHQHRGELIAEVERLLTRQDELLAANNEEVEHRREAQLRLVVVCENVDTFILHSQDNIADLRDMIAKARRNAFQSPAAKPQAPYRAETEAGSAPNAALPAAPQDGSDIPATPFGMQVRHG